jgi:hypothetical protein
MNKIQSFLRNKRILISASSILSASLGGAAGYALAQKKLESAYEQTLVVEIEKTKQFYSTLYNKPSPAELAEPYIGEGVQTEMEMAVGALTDYAGAATQGEVFADRPSNIPDPSVKLDYTGLEEDGSVAPIQVNIFTDKEPIIEHSDGGWNYDEELATRSELEPYIIHHDEYFQGEKEYQQNTLTYYAEDGVLCDERDSPIHDSEAIVGDANLMRFGHGSKDNNILYVRNDRLELDLEVVRSNGSYTREVLGIRHSDEPTRRRGRARRLRDDDE